MTSRVSTEPGPSPCARWDATAPVISKNAPAYAHSFSRGNPGAMRAATASSFQVPRIVRRYGG
jgi:hypothetical protein